MKQILARISWIALAVAGVVALSAFPALAVGTTAGTTITNQATVDYEDANGNPLQALSAVVSTVVSQVAGVSVTPDNSQTANPGDTVPYLHVVENTGNGPDTIDMTTASSQGWTVTLYADDGDGVFEPGTDDPLLADTDTDGTPDTGLLANDTSTQIWAVVDVPAGATDGTVDSTTVTGTSSFNTGVSDLATDTTTVSSPDVAVVKTVAPAGPQPPGATLTYTIVVTNNGAADANAVVLTDPVPANTTYVAGSITEGGAGRTDIGGDDNADYNVTFPNTITVDIGTLAPAASTTVTFQVTIN